MESPSANRPSLTQRASAPTVQSSHPQNDNGQHSAGELAQSLERLTIATASSPATSSHSPRSAVSGPLRPATDAAPVSPRPSGAVRTPLRSASASVNPSSRSETPTLLRKASMNSLHSANGIAPPSRRSSFAQISSPTRHRSARSPLRSLSPEAPPKPLPTPHSVASAHFKAELDVHHGPEPTRRAETVVIFQDACYGHRYSRPRASRNVLSTIFERPERIKACAVGVAAAYVRLGERHQDGAFPIQPEPDAASLPTIPFRIQKSTRRMPLSSTAVTNVHGTKWMEELKMMCDTAELKLAGGGKELQRPDMDRGPDAEEPKKFHEGDLYLCDESLAALEGALGGVCDAVDAVFTTPGPQRAFAVIRPPGHHCSSSHPSGFCWINNVHVGIMHAVLSHGLTHAAIIDFDLHHGDGSQSIAWQHNARSVGSAKNAALWKKTAIGYFSLHDINSYPCETGDEDKVRNASVCIDGAHGQSIWNVHLQPWKTEAEFWMHYETKYSALLQKTRAFLKSHTERLRAAALNSKAAIFLSAGFDASQWEDANMQRHNVNVPTDFYARFTRDVVRIAAEEGTSVEGRIVSVLEGGYSDRALCSGVFSHLCGLAGDGPSSREQERPASRYDMSPRSTPPLRARKDSSASERGVRRYESSWWSAAELERLEATLATPPPAPRIPRNCPPPTYSSPTQASAAKAVAPKNRRSMSNLSPVPNSDSGGRVFWSEPLPPLDVSWTVATLELSKLLIPSGRQTNSYTHEELNAEATKARRERAGLAPPVPAVVEERPPTRMSLRERKAKPAPVVENVDDRKTRRKTVAGPADLASEPASHGAASVSGKQSRSSGRRLSAASTIVSSEGLDTAPAAPRTAPVRGSSKADANNRPESSTSVAATNGNGLNVKKTRAPAKKEPVPRAPRGPRKNATTGAATEPAPAVTQPATANTGDDVDKLAGEMKKVRITVLTKAQKEARERERLAKEKLSDAKGMPTPQSPEETKPPAQVAQPTPTPPAAATSTPLSTPATTTAGPGTKQLPSPTPSPSTVPPPHHQQQQPSATPATPSQELPPLASPPPTTSPRRLPLPASSSPLPSPPPATTVKDETDIFIPYQPDGPTPAGQPQPQQQQQRTLHWLPPNVVSLPPPSPAKDLPVFTSTSVIPFAPGPGLARGEVKMGEGEGEGEGEGGTGKKE